MPKGADMTNLKRSAVEPAPRSGTIISPSSVSVLAPGERHAPIAELSPSKKRTGGLLQRRWAQQERRSLAWGTRWQANIRDYDRRSRARWYADGDHKPSKWFSKTNGTWELVRTDFIV
jgi:hypothetical protein